MKHLIYLLAFATIMVACDQATSNTNNNTEGENTENSANSENTSNNAENTPVNTDVISNENTAGGDEAPKGEAIIQWDHQDHDFGKIHPNETKTHIFGFKNTGNIPLVIHDATATCGCTVPEKPKEPIAPGERGSLTVSFTKSQGGEHRKTVTVTTNAKEAKQYLNIKAFVMDKK